VVVLPGLASPLVWGWGPVRLLWPEGLELVLPTAGRRAVLLHELAHLRRGDHWVGWLLLVGSCVWWWHPLFRLVRRELGRQAERACDAWVVTTLPAARRAYAEALLAVCERCSVTPALALGAMGGKHDLERRLVMILRESSACRLTVRALLGVGLLGLLALPALTLGQDAPKKARSDALDVFEPGAKPDTAPADRDRRVRELEDRVKALLKELQDLKAAKASPAAKAPVEIRRADPKAKPKPEPALRNYYRTLGANRPATVYGNLLGKADFTEVALTRATYSLPEGKAEAVGKFLRDHVKARVLETSVKGEVLTVTTTPEMQRGVAQIVRMVRGQAGTDGGANFFAPARR
jgi:hypothetical protein